MFTNEEIDRINKNNKISSYNKLFYIIPISYLLIMISGTIFILFSFFSNLPKIKGN